MLKIIEVIVSDSDVFIHSLKDNLPVAPNVETHILPINFNIHELEYLPKIDLIVIDGECKNFNHFKDRCKNIIHIANFHNNQIAAIFTKPFKLEDLQNLIITYYECNNLFCLINEQFIYNQKHSYIYTPSNKIKLTEKENEVLNTLLLSEKYTTSLKHITQDIWQYNLTTDSSTVINHLYKLRQKLPNNLLQINSNFINLNIHHLR